MHPRLASFVLLSAVVLAGAACGDDPVSYSAPVGIKLEVKSSDVVDGTVVDDKGITTESGNPFGAFVSDARRQLGEDPARIEVERVDLSLATTSTGVTRLGEVFGGEVAILFVMNTSNTELIVGTRTIDAATDAGPVALAVSFESEDVQGADWTRYLGGSFKVAIRGPTAAEFSGKGADADLQVTFTFAAYE